MALTTRWTPDPLVERAPVQALRDGAPNVTVPQVGRETYAVTIGELCPAASSAYSAIHAESGNEAKLIVIDLKLRDSLRKVVRLGMSASSRNRMIGYTEYRFADR